MSQLGMGAMIHHLSGGSANNPDKFYGKKITEAVLQPEGDGALLLSFEDGTKMRLRDDARSCCEHRYISCDDDLSKLVGGTLRNIEPKDYKETTGEYDSEHETCFVEIATNEASVTICTHNEHNGYYGGFGLTLESVTGNEVVED